jgi:hypothetical protein
MGYGLYKQEWQIDESSGYKNVRYKLRQTYIYIASLYLSHHREYHGYYLA